MNSIYGRRIEECRAVMSEQGFDMMILFPSSHMYYLSGFRDEPGERMLFFLVPIEGDPLFIAPKLYENHIKRDSSFRKVYTWEDSEKPIDILRRSLKDMGISQDAKIAVDDSTWAMFMLSLEDILPKAKFFRASQVISRLRIKKSEEEIRWMSEAGVVMDEVFAVIIRSKICGMTEVELAAFLEYEMKKRGCDKIAFETLVASGPNGAIPHHRAGNRTINVGDVVILDYGCQIHGYCADMSRTIVCGEPSKEVQAVYETVRRAQEEAMQVIKPGIAAQEVDRIARGVISKAGFGENFPHRTGHGIGLDVHEEPYIVEGNDLLLEKGMVFTVEPGIYLPESFGVRIEDTVVVMSSGVRRLTNCTRELLWLN